MIGYDDDDFVSSHSAFYPSFSCSCASSLYPCGASSLNDGVSYRRPMIVTTAWTMHHYYHCHYCCCRHDDNLAFSISNVVSMNADCCRYHCRSPDFGIVSFDQNRDDCDACGPCRRLSGLCRDDNNNINNNTIPKSIHYSIVRYLHHGLYLLRATSRHTPLGNTLQT